MKSAVYTLVVTARRVNTMFQTCLNHRVGSPCMNDMLMNMYYAVNHPVYSGTRPSHQGYAVVVE